jgi:hypothetical protein
MTGTASQFHSLADLILKCLVVPAGKVQVWLDRENMFEAFIATADSKRFLRVTPENALAVRLELANPNALGRPILYATDRATLETFEEVVQCFGSVCTLNIAELIRQNGIDPDSARSAFAQSQGPLLLQTWDAIAPQAWRSGDLDLGFALALRGRDRGDLVDLGLAELESLAKTRTPRLAVEPERERDAAIQSMAVRSVLGDRLLYGRALEADELARALVAHDLAQTPSGADAFGYLLEGRGTDAIGRMVERIADSKKRRDALRPLLESAATELHVDLAKMPFAELARLRIVPGADETLRAGLVAEINAAGPGGAFAALQGRAAIVGRDESLRVFDWALRFEAAITSGNADLASPPGTAAGFLEAYVERWAEIDRLYRRIVGDTTGALRLAVETAYRTWLRDLNTAFGTRMEAEQQWRLPHPQRGVGASFAALEGKLAVLILDAFRYEMARDLCERLAKGLDVQLEWASAAIPTKTEVGMSALVPSAEPLSLSTEGNQLAVRIGDRVTTQKSARDDIWSAAGFRVLDRSECDRVDFDAERIVVFQGDVDTLGEKLQANAFAHFGSTIDEIRKLIERLTALGYRVIATADHGFLTLPPATNAKVELPSPQDDVRKRRYRVSAGEPLEQPMISRNAAELGHHGTVTIDFPPGTSIFKTHGALMFVHGGISLQELVIPVLRVARKLPAGVQQATFAVTFPKWLRGRLFDVTVRAHGVVSAGTKLRLIAKTADGDVSTTKAWLADGEGRMVLKATIPDDIGPGSVELSVSIENGALIGRTSLDFEPHE